MRTNMINVSHVWFCVAFDSFRCAALAYSHYVIEMSFRTVNLQMSNRPLSGTA